MAKRAVNPARLEGPPADLAGPGLTRWIVEVLRGSEGVPGAGTAGTAGTAGSAKAGLGFDLAGVCEAEPVAHQQEVLAWLAAGKHGEMDYLRAQMEARLSPSLELSGAASVIMAGQVYQPAGRQRRADDASVQPLGLVARYAMMRDYHQSIKKRLHKLADALRARFPGEAFRTFVDTAPVLERQYASASGLGWHGKNTMIIHPQLGSYFVLGGMYTTMRLEPSARIAELLQPNMQQTDHCGTCTRCIDACPTGAISERSVDARVCISALTIERRSVIEAELARKMGTWVFGCDICQEVCPFNGETRSGGLEVTSRAGKFDLLAMLGWGEGDRSALGVSAMKRASVAMLRRNAVIALVNHPRFASEPAWQARVREIAEDAGEDEMVREQAREGLGSRQ
jgi:epoxyqueuosine reductase